MNNLKKLGDYIAEVDVKNTNLKVDLLLGVSIDKEFIDSHANTVGTDFSGYKIVKKGQFAYGPVTSRNGDKISVALLKEADECLVSSSYSPFEITKKDELLPEYLMLIFSNPEFDRYARYNSWGSAREVFSWDEMCNTYINVPPLDEQKNIVGKFDDINRKIDISLKKKEELYQYLNSLFTSINSDSSKIEFEDVSLTDNSVCQAIKSGINRFDNEKKYYATSDIENDYFCSEGVNVSLKDRPSRANMQPSEYSIWFAKMKNTRKIISFEPGDENLDAILSTGFYGLKVEEDYFYYFWSFICNPNFEATKDLECNGTTQEALNDDGAKKITISIPYRSEIIILNKQLKAIYDYISVINKEVFLLRKLKSEYLKQLF